MTNAGENRERYAREHRHDDPRPSRFTNEGRDYRAWAERADAWAIEDESPSRDAGILLEAALWEIETRHSERPDTTLREMVAPENYAEWVEPLRALLRDNLTALANYERDYAAIAQPIPRAAQIRAHAKRHARRVLDREANA